jgi:hypothetical protein
VGTVLVLVLVVEPVVCQCMQLLKLKQPLVETTLHRNRQLLYHRAPGLQTDVAAASRLHHDNRPCLMIFTPHHTATIGQRDSRSVLHKHTVRRTHQRGCPAAEYMARQGVAAGDLLDAVGRPGPCLNLRCSPRM